MRFSSAFFLPLFFARPAHGGILMRTFFNSEASHVTGWKEKATSLCINGLGAVKSQVQSRLSQVDLEALSGLIKHNAPGLVKNKALGALAAISIIPLPKAKEEEQRNFLSVLLAEGRTVARFVVMSKLLTSFDAPMQLQRALWAYYVANKLVPMQSMLLSSLVAAVMSTKYGEILLPLLQDKLDTLIASRDWNLSLESLEDAKRLLPVVASVSCLAGVSTTALVCSRGRQNRQNDFVDASILDEASVDISELDQMDEETFLEVEEYEFELPTSFPIAMNTEIRQRLGLPEPPQKKRRGFWQTISQATIRDEDDEYLYLFEDAPVLA